MIRPAFARRGLVASHASSGRCVKGKGVRSTDGETEFFPRRRPAVSRFARPSVSRHESCAPTEIAQSNLRCGTIQPQRPCGPFHATAHLCMTGAFDR
ncbi:MAG: hypothetical protein D6725_14255 [Planctomycetota bacterium]|nr:MAG: hypothetical protein D6725_14255 [Planctomycetota bacterium]